MAGVEGNYIQEEMQGKNQESKLVKYETHRYVAMPCVLKYSASYVV